MIGNSGLSVHGTPFSAKISSTVDEGAVQCPITLVGRREVR
jgi:hypothetical protein